MENGRLEGGVDVFGDDDAASGGAVVAPVVVVVDPKAPSRVSIWTCIRHLINSIGVLRCQHSLHESPVKESRPIGQ